MQDDFHARAHKTIEISRHNREYMMAKEAAAILLPFISRHHALKIYYDWLYVDTTSYSSIYISSCRQYAKQWFIFTAYTVICK